VTDELTLTFDPNTIEHLGFRMYSRLPNAVAELVANAYDADAGSVVVTLDTSGSQSVEVADDGHGMSAADVSDRYLRIGRNRRGDDSGLSESGRRRVAGRKGLGKLALFGIGKRITIRTKRAGSPEWLVVTMDWKDIKDASGGEYHPKSHRELAGSPSDKGTTILVEELQRKSPLDAKSLAHSLARLFNYTDDSFVISVKGARTPPIDVTRELRYSEIEKEKEWFIPSDLENPSDGPDIRGRIITSVKPLPQEMRGITLYVKGRLANDPEYFGVPESSYAFSYITGYVDADYLDDLEEDVIATDRRAVSWEGAEATALRTHLADILREIASRRRESRKQSKRARLKNDLGVDVDSWVSTIQDDRRSSSVREVLEVLESPDTELSEEDRMAIVIGMNEIAPEYADFHWRTLHPRIQDASESLYKSGNYYHAVLEATKRYVTDVRTASGIDAAELTVIQGAFVGEQPKLDVVSGAAAARLAPSTRKNVRDAQRSLSEGLWAGFRSPLAHEETSLLHGANIFTFQDCLDALSLVSHLRRRIDQPDDDIIFDADEPGR
jgi:uncharacterized protein (TIGR02391 family)